MVEIKVFKYYWQRTRDGVMKGTSHLITEKTHFSFFFLERNICNIKRRCVTTFL